MSSHRTQAMRSESKSAVLGEDKMDKVKSEYPLYSLQAEPSEKRSSHKTMGLLGPPDILGPPETIEIVERPGLRRQLTHHVVTRWYRAPEVILSQNYDAEVDIW